MCLPWLPKKDGILVFVLTMTKRWQSGCTRGDDVQKISAALRKSENVLGIETYHCSTHIKKTPTNPEMRKPTLSLNMLAPDVLFLSLRWCPEADSRGHPIETFYTIGVVFNARKQFASSSVSASVSSIVSCSTVYRRAKKMRTPQVTMPDRWRPCRCRSDSWRKHISRQ